MALCGVHGRQLPRFWASSIIVWTGNTIKEAIRQRGVERAINDNKHIRRGGICNQTAIVKNKGIIEASIVCFPHTQR